ncbi:MAG TPA: hypothetical protein VJM76_05190, partial [Gammaproteobacteria bacterium]|nr:hypothetical protein [Gammaproteobacteria bacterium]
MAAPRQLHLLVPQLFGPELSGVNGKLAASELEILLARSARSACATNTNTLLFELFGVEADSERLPIAPLTYASDTGSAPPGWCLRADPVYMRADSDRVFLMGNDFLSVHPHEAEALASELAPLLQEYGGQLSTPSPKRWYLDLPRDPGIYGQDLQSVRGCDIHRFLASESQGSENAKLWRRILNEVQMVLHGSPVNTAREARGELPINSLWFWGGGRLPAAGAQHLVQACTNNIVGLALAQLTITPHTPAPAIASD